MEKKKENSSTLKKKTTKKKTEVKKTLKKTKISSTKTKKKKTKAFTLIELLAVIIILGVLMIIAIPSVTTYISNSRKSSYIDTAKNIAGATRNLVNSGKLEMYDPTVTYYIPVSCIKTENGSKTPYGEFTEAYVGVIYDGTGYNYYWISTDSSLQGVGNITAVDKLDVDSISSGIGSSDVANKIEKTSILGRNKILILNSDCDNWNNELSATNNINENGDFVEDAFIANPIYWALQDNDSNNVNETLVLSKNEVHGKLEGVFSGDTVFTSSNQVPWINSSYLSNDNLSRNVTNLTIESIIYPTSTSYWFNGVGYTSNSMVANFSNLKVDNVINMSYMFYSFAPKATQFNYDFSNWNTSNVTDMSWLFCNSGRNATSWSIGNLSNWNTSKVTNMKNMFGGQEKITSWSVGDLRNWNTSNVTDMSGMFGGVGGKATTLDLSYLKYWDVSKVKRMSGMFEETGQYVTNLVIDLSQIQSILVQIVFKYIIQH